MLDSIGNIRINELIISIKTGRPHKDFLGPHFLSSQGIVPQDWQVDQFLVVSGQTSEVKYQNGISIVDAMDKFLFLEGLPDGIPEESKAPGVARRFAASIPDLSCRSIGSEFTGDLSLSKGEWDRVLLDNLSCDGLWLQFHGRKGGATVRFSFTAEGVTVGLAGEDPDPMWLEYEGKTVVSFVAKFERPVPRRAPVETILRTIDLWQSDLMTFESFVCESFVFEA